MKQAEEFHNFSNACERLIFSIMKNRRLTERKPYCRALLQGNPRQGCTVLAKSTATNPYLTGSESFVVQDMTFGYVEIIAERVSRFGSQLFAPRLLFCLYLFYLILWAAM